MKNKGSHKNQGKWPPKKLFLAFVLVLLVAVCVFSQSGQGLREQRARGWGEKLDPALAWLDRHAALPEGETVAVIVQFSGSGPNDEAWQAAGAMGEKEEVVAQGKARVIYESGGEPQRYFKHFMAH